LVIVPSATIQRSALIVTPKLASGQHRQETIMNSGKRISWQIAAVAAAAIFAGCAQAHDRGHSGRNDGHRDRGWHDQGRYDKRWHNQGRYENGRHDYGSRHQYGYYDRGHKQHHWAPAPPRHWRQHGYYQGHGYYSRSSWPYEASGAQLIVSVPLF
jgi:hypothetical protein